MLQTSTTPVFFPGNLPSGPANRVIRDESSTVSILISSWFGFKSTVCKKSIIIAYTRGEAAPEQSNASTMWFWLSPYVAKKPLCISGLII